MKLSSSALPSVVVAGDPHDVLAMVLRDEVGVLGVDQGLAHPLGVVDVLAEDDGLVVAVGRLAGTRRSARRPASCAARGPDVAVEVPLVVDRGPRSRWPMSSALPFSRPPAEQVLVEVDADDLVGGEEAVLDALLERVGVDRVAEVVDVGDVLRSPSAWPSCRSGWRRRSSRGSRARRSPRAALPRWHSSIDDQVEEVRRELLVDVLVFLGAR